MLRLLRAPTFLCVLFLFGTQRLQSSDRYITYIFNGGRFGDTLITYSKAKYLSYKYGIPLLYKPFKYSDKLVMHTLDKHHSISSEKLCGRIVMIDDEKQLIDEKGTALFVVSYYTKTNQGLYRLSVYDTEFSKMLHHAIQSRSPLQLTLPPRDTISVALHVRKGGGADAPLLARRRGFADVSHPSKFPPDSFYVEQLKKLSEMFDHAPLHVHMFTDDKHPEALIEKYRKMLGLANIHFSYKKTSTGPNEGVLEDFFSMLLFDCLIKPASSFSSMAKILGQHKVVISANHGIWVDDSLIIDKVRLTLRGGDTFNTIDFSEVTQDIKRAVQGLF